MDMTVTAIVDIDLAEFGGEGTMRMGMPSLRRLTEIKNETSRYVRLMKAEDNTYMDGLQQGDLEILSVLMYVREAPFKATIEGFLGYTDKLDAVCVGNGQRLMRKMQEVMREFEAISSPFANSQEAETASSE